MKMEQKNDVESGQVEKGKGNIFARKKWSLLGITIFICLIGFIIVLCLVDLKPTSNHSEPVPPKILETKTLKWRFPESDFDLCCSTIENTQYYLKTCNEIFNPKNIKCVDVDKGSIILTLESTLIDFEKGVLNALSEINHIGGQSTKEHRKYEPGQNIEQKPKVPDLEPNKPDENIEPESKVPDLHPKITDVTQCEPNEHYPITEEACDCGLTGACFKGQYCYLTQGSIRCLDGIQKEENKEGEKKEGENKEEENKMLDLNEKVKRTQKTHEHGFQQYQRLEVFSKTYNAWMVACDFKLIKDDEAIISYRRRRKSGGFKTQVNLRDTKKVRLRDTHIPAIPHIFHAVRGKTKVKAMLETIEEESEQNECEENV